MHFLITCLALAKYDIIVSILAKINKLSLTELVCYLLAAYKSNMKLYNDVLANTINIAQYENHKKAITISNSYIYAAPQVIAAYLSHESVHAHDNDSYTSIREEQDAYQVAAKFWMKNAGGIKDPEMDYAVSLYQQSPSKLNDRVAEIYKLRDPGIAETSPNHPPKKLFHFNMSKTKAASQSIKSYDVIA